jgi:carboxylesterase
MVKNIYKKVKSVLFANPRALYEKDQAFLNKSFYFSGTNGKAVLLIHGWTSTPYEVRRAGMFLNENGYTVSAPMLRGHGTVPKDLENVKWTDWLADITKIYDDLKKEHGKVYVGGTSLGANLTLMLAKNRPEISALILMAMPLKLRIERTVIFFGKVLGFFKKYNKKFYPPTFGHSTTITRVISYQTYPVKSALEVFELIKIARKEIGKVKQPCFMLQSTSDHIAARGNLEMIYRNIGSKLKKKKYIKRAYHTFISDIKNEGVFDEILNFIKNL